MRHLIKTLLLCIGSMLLLSGCMEKEKFVVYGATTQGKDVEIIVKDADYVERATVIQFEDSMLVAVQIKPWRKWQKAKLEKKLQKQLDKKYPKQEILVSADYKIFYEANKIKKEQLENTKLNERLTKLKELAKEQT
ncbi:hypothetical protein [Lysinibacillus piscis]|uniref:Sporulation protein n=1 Tax=Lysinibacillus piscis TaxID=2518931 RepID=A0ABQ5NI20_9BACI|nr:hypothetical protein [Lysinibacillus sp. KH24]GLC87726.1 hypothetical protein LYSBPC_08530 [Lysinibacillus sp. KH24]